MTAAGGPLPGGFASVRDGVAAAIVPRSVLLLEGSEAFDFLHRMTTNDVRHIEEGASRRTVVVTEKGRAIDLVTVTNRAGDALVTGSPGLAETLSSWFERFIITDDVRLKRAELKVDSLLGPRAEEAAASLGPDRLIVREGLGAIPCLLLFDRGRPLEAPPGQLHPSPGIPMVDANVLEALRIEELVPAAGAELGPEVNALEAGLKRFISFSKGCYIGQEVIARLDTYRKLQRIIALFRIHAPSGPPPAPGTLTRGGHAAGRITSVASSPTHGGWVGLGFRQISGDDPEYRLTAGEGLDAIRCTCISQLPEGYEEYAVENA